MAAELAPDGIRVCAIAPVMAETPLLPTFMGGDSPELRAQFKATVPLGRFATIDDVANATLFLASERGLFPHRQRAGGRWRAVRVGGSSPSGEICSVHSRLLALAPLPCGHRLVGCGHVGS